MNRFTFSSPTSSAFRVLNGLVDKITLMSIDQTTQRRDLVQQREEIERQAVEIRSLQAHIQALEMANMRQSAASRQGSGPYTPLGSTPSSPSAERYSPVQNYDPPRHALYSSSPVDRAGQPHSGLVMPTLLPRRRVTVSDQYQAARGPHQPSAYPVSGGPANLNAFRAGRTTPTSNIPMANTSNPTSQGPSAVPTHHLQNGPFHALAAASGVLLPENEVSTTFVFPL